MPRRDFDPASVTADGRAASKETLFDGAAAGPWRGVVEGVAWGGQTTVLAYGTDTIGEGPRLHVHPYDETFIVIAGRARFFVGDTTLEAAQGDVVFGPAGVPHRFENLGPGRLQTIDIHHSPKWIQTDLD
ncbi:cupin domain-containing protein [Brevundimonas sp. Root1279]|uniref:cupin domain-containing protein n=1 Tax=Brevundimonas sp. Root1279 TaxID=1736443 RepID=UPI0006F72D6D|nr:cupin domain-containing protein [Brevundimonas sp. Root1279]KQW79638.1 cupin [Brevundimonas sp. Root1279]